MKTWIFTTKEILEYAKLDEDDKLKRAAPIQAKKGDVILVYRGKPHSNIKFIFTANNNAYKDTDFRDDWEIAIDLFDKIELKNPIRISEMKDDPILGEWNVVRKNFMGSFFEIHSKELNRLKTLILEKNPELEDKIESLFSGKSGQIDGSDQKWTFAINKDFYFNLQKLDEIIWNSAKQVKKNDLIMVYTGAPYSSIGFVLKANTDPYEDPGIREEWNRPAIKVKKILEIPKPISLQELRKNPILSQWGAIKMGFRGSHFKMSDEEYNELKRLILEKNQDLLWPKKIEIRYLIEKGLNEYSDAKKDPFNSSHSMYKLLKEELPKVLENLTLKPELYKFDGSAGQGNWTYSSLDGCI